MRGPVPAPRSPARARSPARVERGRARERGAREWRGKGMEGQGNGGAREWRGKGMEGQGNGGAREWEGQGNGGQENGRARGWEARNGGQGNGRGTGMDNSDESEMRSWAYDDHAVEQIGPWTFLLLSHLPGDDASFGRVGCREQPQQVAARKRPGLLHRVVDELAHEPIVGVVLVHIRRLGTVAARSRCSPTEPTGTGCRGSCRSIQSMRVTSCAVWHGVHRRACTSLIAPANC